MYVDNKLLVLFTGFLWGFGFLSGLLYSKSNCDTSVEGKVDGLPSYVGHVRSFPSQLKDSSVKSPSSPTADVSCTLFNNSFLKMDKFSIIIPTYKRLKLLKQVLENYCSLVTHVDTIVVVWNNVDASVPSELTDFPCSVDLVIKKAQVNSLNNRFIHYPEIKTQAVLSADDDLLILHEDLIYQFNTWKEFKHLITGFAPRKHVEKPPNSGYFVYGGPPKDGSDDRRYSFILTTSAMFHVQYLNLYQSALPDNLRKFVDDNMNCEDIFFNAIVADHLHKAMGSQLCPALLVPYKQIKMIEGENKGYRGLWSRPKHKKIRDKCLLLISNHFNGFPFNYSTFKITTA